jgi:hypothetical protein
VVRWVESKKKKKSRGRGSDGKRVTNYYMIERERQTERQRETVMERD